MSTPGYAKQCGVCHVGGGQLEYDYDMKPYGDASSTDVASKYIYRVPLVDGSTGAVIAGSGGIHLTSDAGSSELLGANKAEVDCMMCHAANTQTAAAYYKSTMGCAPGNLVGPADNMNCDGFFDKPFQPGVNDTNNPDTRFTFTPGAFYDTFNRNIAVSKGYFAQAASAGIGAGVNLSTGTLSNVPSTIPAGSIAFVPNSANCAACHARTNSDNIGLPGQAAAYGGMVAGFGNYVRMTPPKGAFDWDKIDANGNCSGDCSNTTTWMEFGCKTGMGKRAQRAGVGTQDRFGFGVCLGCSSFYSMMGMPANWFIGMDGTPGNADDGVCGLPSVQAACSAKAGADLTANANAIWAAPGMPVKITGKMSDTDVHDAKGLKCGTCHNAVSGDRPAKTITGGGVSYTYTALTVTANTSLHKIDHQMAQGFSTMEKADDINDGTVTCEACHIERHHDNAGSAPVPAHAGFPSLHFDKIDCRTCHIPKVYSSPGRLLFRDWTAGAFRQPDGSNGNANHFDFAYDFMEGGAAPMIPLKTWITAGGHTKITAVLPSMLPVWTGPVKKASDGTIAGWAPLKTRDITAAAAKVSAGNPLLGIKLNRVHDYPMFQGFQLTDPLKMESQAKHNALRDELLTGGAGLATHATVTDPRLNLFPLFFDVSHGVTPTTETLGAASKGGCKMCHSSSNPASPYYSEYSVGFFDMEKDMLKNGMMQMADYDCGDVNATGQLMYMCFDAVAKGGNGNGTCDAPELAACKSYIANQLYPMFGMPADIKNVMPIDGIDMMQLFALREGSMAKGCDSRFQFFGFPNNGRMAAAGSMMNASSQPTNGCCALGTEPGCAGDYDYHSRAEIRTMFKKNLQQSIFAIASSSSGTWTHPVSGNVEQVPANLKRVFSIVARAKNPSNPADPWTTGKFDMGSMCYTFDADGMINGTAACADGGYVATRINESQLLGYSADQLTHLMSINPVVNNAPLAKISYSISNLTVTFNGANSSNAVSYSWNLGDGTTANTASTTRTYAAAGTKTVTLTVTNADGVSNTATAVITLAAANNAPTMTTSVAVVNKVATITYAALDSDATNTLRVFVNWGDGTSAIAATGVSPLNGTIAHTYSDGTYTAYVAVTDQSGGHKVNTVAIPAISTSMGTINGVITSGTTSIGGAVVTLYTANSTTVITATFSAATPTTRPDLGAYTLSNIPLGGTYDIKVQKAGYNTTMVEDVVISSATPTTVNITMTPVNTGTLFTISGVISGPTPTGTLVQLMKVASPTIIVVAQQTLTDGSGNFTFVNVPNGTYRINPEPYAPATVTNDGYEFAVNNANVDLSTMVTFTYNP